MRKFRVAFLYGTDCRHETLVEARDVLTALAIANNEPPVTEVDWLTFPGFCITIEVCS